MAGNSSSKDEISPVSTASMNAWTTISSLFPSSGVSKTQRLSTRLASIHGAVDQELQPDYHAEWEKLYRASTDHRSATEADNINIYSAINMPDNNVGVAVQVALQTDQQQQQQQQLQIPGGRKLKASTWQWPEWDMGLKHRTVVSVPISPRRNAP